MQLNKLANAQQARLEKSLNQVFRYSEGVMTRRTYIERHVVRVDEAQVPSVEWNRIKFNRMNHAEQREYEAKLAKKKTTWRAYVASGGFIEIPKIVFDWWVENHHEQLNAS